MSKSIHTTVFNPPLRVYPGEVKRAPRTPREDGWPPRDWAVIHAQAKKLRGEQERMRALRAFGRAA